MHNSSALSHPWLHRGRLTCMPLHSAANYFPLRETTAVLTLKYWHIQQQRLKNISPLHLHTPWGKGKNTTSSVRLWKSTYFNQTCTDSIPKGFTTDVLKAAIIYIYTFACVVAEALRWGTRWRLHRSGVQTPEMMTEGNQAYGQIPLSPLFLHHMWKQGSNKPHWSLNSYSYQINL